MSELLLGDDPPPPKRRPRWVDSLGLVAIVLGMVAIGVLGDRGERDDSAQTPATTTSTLRAPGPTPYRPSTTTSVTVPAPRTLPRALAQDTGTVLLLQGPSSSQVYDVDRGVVRSLLLGEAGYPAFSVPGGFLLGGRSELAFLGVDADEPRSFSLELRGSSWPIGVATGGAWVQGPGGVLEVGFDGRPTGRHHELPPSAYPVGVVDRGLVVAQYSSLTLVEHGGWLRPLGQGSLWGLGGDTVVVVACEALACELRVLDVRTSEMSRVIELGPEAGQLDDPGKISPDGRWLVYRSYAGQVRGLIAVDLEGGSLNPIPASGDVGSWTFASRGSVLFAAMNNDLAAYDLATGEWTPLPGIPVARVTSITAASR